MIFRKYYQSQLTADFPTPPAPTTTNLYSVIVAINSLIYYFLYSKTLLKFFFQVSSDPIEGAELTKILFNGVHDF